ncbi:hypothetical protein C8J57DRAFT_1728701 [Mycena rebaudengoi]|nr:hypothetical protein C8J57DRAFT_1728701 [Mycena rebaudengoi]
MRRLCHSFLVPDADVSQSGALPSCHHRACPPSGPASFSLVYERTDDHATPQSHCLLSSPTSSLKHLQPAPFRRRRTLHAEHHYHSPPLRRPSHCPQHHSAATRTPAPAEMRTNSIHLFPRTHYARSPSPIFPVLPPAPTPPSTLPPFVATATIDQIQATRHPIASFDATRHPYFADSPYATSRAAPHVARQHLPNVPLRLPRYLAPLVLPVRRSHVPRPWTTPFATNTTRICSAAACSPSRLARAQGLRPGTGRNPMLTLEDCPGIAAAVLFVPTRAPPRHSSFVLTTIARPTTKSFTGFFSRFLCAPAAPTGVWNTVLKKSGEICLPGRGWELRQWRRLRARLCPSRRRDLLVTGRGHYPRGRALDGSSLHPLAARALLLLRFLWSRLRADGSAPAGQARDLGPAPRERMVKPSQAATGQPLLSVQQAEIARAGDTGHMHNAASTRFGAIPLAPPPISDFSDVVLLAHTPLPDDAVWGGLLGPEHGGELPRIGRQGGAPVPVCEARC